MARVTIEDIARHAGVSKTAVSFAFNDPGRLPEATVGKILRVAEELGYTPHPVARSLSKGRTGVIGVLVPQDIATVLENPFFIQMLRGIGRTCLEKEGSVLLAAPIRDSLQNTIDRAMVDGFVVVLQPPTITATNMMISTATPNSDNLRITKPPLSLITPLILYDCLL